MRFLPAVIASAALFACGPVSSQTSFSEQAVVTPNDNGTELFAGTSTLASLVCVDQSSATATITGTLTTTGSVDSAEIHATIDGAGDTIVGTIQPQDFVHDGRIKTAAYSVSLTIPNGTHTIGICFVQSGSQGRTPKETCADPITVTVACENSCAGVGFFGDLVGNPNLCKGNGPPHIPVHVKGDLGDAPSLAISGPGGYALSATMDHAGESCVYQYNWDTAGNGGAGTYHFQVTGNGGSYDFDAQLQCH